MFIFADIRSEGNTSYTEFSKKKRKQKKKEKRVSHIWNKNKRTKVESEKRKYGRDEESRHLWMMYLHV